MADHRIRSFLLIVNPVSGRGTGRKRASELAAALGRRGLRVETVETRARGSATELAALGASRHDAVVAVGGDGTLNEVLRGLWSLARPAEELPALGFFPSGTANAAAPAFRLPVEAEAAATLFHQTPPKAADFGVVTTGGGDRPFLLWCGAGYDAVVIDVLNSARTGRMGLLGLARNAPAVTRRILRYDEPPVAVECDGQRWVGMAGAVVANVSEIAFGATIAASADPFDGVLDVVSVPAGAKARLPAMTVAMFSSSLQSVRAARTAQVVSVRMTSAGEVPVQVDGEPAGRLPLEVRVVAGGIRLLVPR